MELVISRLVEGVERLRGGAMVEQEGSGSIMRITIGRGVTRGLGFLKEYIRVR